MPRWERDVPPDEIASYAEEGKPLHVEVELREASAGQVVGSYVRMIAKDVSASGEWALVVTTNEGERKLARRDVERVDVRTGSHWATGLAVGAAIDGTLLVLGGLLLLALSGLRM